MDNSAKIPFLLRSHANVGKLVKCFNYEHDQIKTCIIGIVISYSQDYVVVLANGIVQGFWMRDVMFVDEWGIEDGKD